MIQDRTCKKGLKSLKKKRSRLFSHNRYLYERLKIFIFFSKPGLTPKSETNRGKCSHDFFYSSSEKKTLPFKIDLFVFRFSRARVYNGIAIN